MKLASVLSKYLVANKQLSLPGLGTFFCEGAYDPDYDGKKQVTLHNITFKQEKVDAADDSVIEFISKETGKMKVLAASDLSSQLDDVIEFINTGKPYFLTGIGTIAKKQTGVYEFFPEKFTTVAEKKKEKEIPITEKNTVPQAYIDNSSRKPRNLKPAITIITLSLIAIAAVVWLYVRNAEQHEQQASEDVTGTNVPATVIQPADSTTKKDSSAAPVKANNSDTYTYVLETTKEPRASKRFNQLKTINWPVELEVVDSLNKRIVMKLPRAGADTTRIKDSLRVLSGRTVFIAQ